MMVAKQNCHPDRSVAQRRDLLFLVLTQGLKALIVLVRGGTTEVVP
jgi:hypothetical protein